MGRLGRLGRFWTHIEPIAWALRRHDFGVSIDVIWSHAPARSVGSTPQSPASLVT
jgi:hypothetical protein